MRAGTKEINEKIFQLADDPQTLIRLKQSELLRDKIIVTMTGSLLIKIKIWTPPFNENDK